MRVVPLLALLALAAAAQAAPSIAPSHGSSVDLTLLSGSTLPIKIVAGPDPGATVSLTNTGSAASLSGGTLGGSASANSTVLQNPTTTAWRVRLVSLQVTPPFSECQECSIKFVGGATTTQLAILNGVGQGTTGPWVTIHAGTNLGVRVTADSNTLANDKSFTWSYQLEVEPATGAGSPRAHYGSLSTTWTV